MEGIFSWILLGLAAGIVARFVVKGPHNFGCISTIVLGILGSVVGGTALNLLAGNSFELKASGFIGAAVGAIAVLALAKLRTSGKHST